jgi:hypothetical protein
VRAADLLFALDEELNVQGQAAFLGREGLGGLQHQVDRPLVVGDAAAADHVAVDAQLERGSQPFRRIAGGLHVVVPVHQDGRRAGLPEPLGAHDRVAVGRRDPAPGELELPGEPLRGGAHGGGVGVPADARDGHVLRQLPQVTGVVGVKVQHGRRRWRWSAR